jgi:mannose-1-phosphate guanylyltransferase
MIKSLSNKVRPVILCGGSGTRLWPISTPKIPKQFISLGEKGTLLEETIRRINLVMHQCQKEGYQTYDPLLVMHRDHTLPSELSMHESNIVYEDYANDTAVAVAKAVLEIKHRHGEDNVIMVVLPADHYIENIDAFVCDITQGIRNVSDDNIVLYGIDPISPETKYGYIIPSLETRVNGAFNVLGFREKPNRDVAIELIKQNALWNSGIFTSTVNLVDKCLNGSRYNIMDWIRNPREGKAASFDVAVLQEYSKIYAQHCLNWKWSDVGSFVSFTAIPEVQSEINNSVITADCSNISVLNRNNNNIVVIGCHDLFIVVNGHDLLIMSSKDDHDNRLKEIATRIYQK